MSIAFTCAGCGRTFNLDDHMAGRTAKCAVCATVFTVPGEMSARPAAPSPLMAGPPAIAAAAVPGDAFDNFSPAVSPPLARKPGRKGLLIGACIAGALLVGGGVLATLWFLGVFSAGLGSEAKYLPDDCAVVVSVRPAQILSSDAYKEFKENGQDFTGGLRALGPLAGGAPDAAQLEENFKREFGVAMADVEHFLVGAPKPGGSVGDHTTTVIRTSKPIKASDILSAKQGSTFTEEKVNAYTLNVNEHGGLAFCVTESKVVVFGGKETLKKVLERNKKPKFTDGLEAAMKQADFSDSIAFAIDLKEMGGGPIPGVDMKGVEGLALSIHLKSDVKASLTLLCKDSQSAGDTKKSLDEGLGTIKKLPLPGDLVKILDDVSLSTSGTKVKGNVRFKVSTVLKSLKDAAGKQSLNMEVPNRPTKPPFRQEAPQSKDPGPEKP